jgi:hypothetical protein
MPRSTSAAMSGNAVSCEHFGIFQHPLLVTGV